MCDEKGRLFPPPERATSTYFTPHPALQQTHTIFTHCGSLLQIVARIFTPSKASRSSDTRIAVNMAFSAADLQVRPFTTLGDASSVLHVTLPVPGASKRDKWMGELGCPSLVLERPAEMEYAVDLRRHGTWRHDIYRGYSGLPVSSEHARMCYVVCGCVNPCLCQTSHRDERRGSGPLKLQVVRRLNLPSVLHVTLVVSNVRTGTRQAAWRTHACMGIRGASGQR